MGIIKIAIAEDEIILRKTLVQNLHTLEKMKVTIEASNGKILLDFLQNQKVDVIILDIEMPVMDGEETLVAIRNLFPDLKVIMHSSHSNETTIKKFIELGANNFICKHRQFQDLIEAIEELY